MKGCLTWQNCFGKLGPYRSYHAKSLGVVKFELVLPRTYPNNVGNSENALEADALFASETLETCFGSLRSLAYRRYCMHVAFIETDLIAVHPKAARFVGEDQGRSAGIRIFVVIRILQELLNEMRRSIVQLSGSTKMISGNIRNYKLDTCEPTGQANLEVL